MYLKSLDISARIYRSLHYLYSKTVFLIFFSVFGISSAGAQSFSVKTNALYDALAVPNLGLELRVNKTHTLELTGAFNPFSYSDTRKWKVMMAQAEYRFWVDKAFSGTFWGFNAVGGAFNMSSAPYGIIGSGTGRYEGNFVGGGLSCGYRWNFSRHWGMEVSGSLDYLHIRYDSYKCGVCGSRTDRKHANYVGPTRIDLSFIYTIK